MEERLASTLSIQVFPCHSPSLVFPRSQAPAWERSPRSSGFAEGSSAAGVGDQELLLHPGFAAREIAPAFFLFGRNVIPRLAANPVNLLDALPLSRLAVSVTVHELLDIAAEAA